MKNLVEFEFPRLCLIIDHSFVLVLRDVHSHSLHKKNELKLLLTEADWSNWMFFEAKSGVGLVLMTTLICCCWLILGDK